MKITMRQLMQQTKPAPVYLISGDEILLVAEACASIRGLAEKHGFSARQIIHVEPSYNWDDFLLQANNLSLFDDQSIMELHLKNKLSDSGAKILQQYAAHPAKNKILLVITAKADAAMQKTAWFKALDAAGISIPIWPIETTDFPAWIANRVKREGLKIDAEGIKILVEFAAGNLLAAAQEIEKLKLLYTTSLVTSEQIISAISDNARFNVFNLVDTSFQGNNTATIRIMRNLQNEKIEPTIVLWAIAREIRTLINIKTIQAQGQSLDQALETANIWSKRKVIVRKALANYNLPQLETLLQQIARIDLIIKGAAEGNVWNELERIFV